MCEIGSANTPNGRKAAIVLDATRLAYAAHAIDFVWGDRDTPEFRRPNPNGKTPALNARDGNTWVAEAGAADHHRVETLAGHPHLKQWRDSLWPRPAIARGMNLVESGPNA